MINMFKSTRIPNSRLPKDDVLHSGEVMYAKEESDDVIAARCDLSENVKECTVYQILDALCRYNDSDLCLGRRGGCCFRIIFL